MLAPNPEPVNIAPAGRMPSQVNTNRVPPETTEKNWRDMLQQLDAILEEMVK